MRRQTLKITTIAAACITVSTTAMPLLGADRLDDWSSPRPIKYGQTVAPKSGAPQPVVSQSVASRNETPAPVPAIIANEPAPAAAKPSVVETAQPRPTGLFPAPQPMQPDPRTSGSGHSISPPALASQQVAPPALAAQQVAPLPPTQSAPRVAQRPADSNSRMMSIPSLEQPVPVESTSVMQRHTFRPPPVEETKLPVPAISTKTVSGWQLGRLANQKIALAEGMLKRRAPMSARRSALEALHLLAQSTDEMTSSHSGTEALDQGLAATREAADFLGRFGSIDSKGIRRLVDAHSTRVLKRCDLEGVSALRAADTYYEFARGRFVDAVGGWSVASKALTILAKTEPTASTESDGNLSAAQICCLRAAVACDPANALAANELGHELLALGLYDEARWALEHSYASKPSTEALQNLAELHRVTGNTQLAQACTTNLASLQTQEQRVAQVVQLSPSQFASVSPMVMAGTEPPVGAAPSSSPAYVAQGDPRVVYPNSQPPSTTVARQPGAPGFNPALPQHVQPQRGRMARAVDGVSNAFKGMFR